MQFTRLAFSVVLCLALSAQVVSAAGGGGGGGFSGGGGGSSGTDLNKVFRDGLELLEDGECKKAEKKFRKIVKAVPRNPEANYFRGVALQCQEKHKAATRYLKKATRYDDKMYAAYEKLGMSYLALGEPDEARSQLEALDSLRQECRKMCSAELLQAHATLASAIAEPNEEVGKPAGTGQHSLLFERVEQPQATYLSVVQLINSERFEQAIEELRKLTTAIGPHPDVLNYLGYAHRRLRQFERAQFYYEQALTLDPLHRGANEYLGEMWVELGRVEEARARLAVLDEACPFGCAEYEDLKRLIELRLVAAQ
jgi:Flp pilus assembly protein TadD